MNISISQKSRVKHIAVTFAPCERASKGTDVFIVIAYQYQRVDLRLCRLPPAAWFAQ